MVIDNLFRLVRIRHIFIFGMFLLLPSVSHAHGLYVSSKEGQLHASFSDRSPASGAVITVVDEDGIVIISLFAVLVVRKALVTVWRCKGIAIFFILTAATLLWTKEGRVLAPVLITKMLAMWLWGVVWISWVGFEGILATFEKLMAPPVFIHTVAFTARFLPLLSERLKMLFAAQASRGAKRGLYLLQLHTLAGGIGSLLVASFEQAENVERAMQSRGFSGKLHLLGEENNAVVVPYGSLIFLFFFACIVWFGVFSDVLCYPCPEFIFQVSKWRPGAV